MYSKSNQPCYHTLKIDFSITQARSDLRKGGIVMAQPSLAALYKRFMKGQDITARGRYTLPAHGHAGDAVFTVEAGPGIAEVQSEPGHQPLWQEAGPGSQSAAGIPETSGGDDGQALSG